ncbi:hypothetical protein OGM63_21265 [Plectonema radiosum NIES-515]|uniref:TPR repeat-containing protein n=1 Tax=Plectonema radiosum NIES-515 TaxID=2986073 RepID=A0ABT3B3P7_9CYAN|nr:hypothetical protein [Plectonema radiosum]MCV3216007.1 hypothetical protein [Plectonema radiosum NIES-515]
MEKESENRLKHFAALKSKYQAIKYQDSSPESLLYLILRKVDLGIKLTELEFDWLRKQELCQTLEIIWLEQRRTEEAKRLEADFYYLKTNYKVPNHCDLSLTSFLYPILWKLKAENQLSDSEIKFLKDNNLEKTVDIVEEIKRFNTLKAKYQATKHQDSSPNSPLYQILKKLEITERLSDEEANWLYNEELLETLEIFLQQEAARKAEFASLKTKYQVNKQLDSVSELPLYRILQKLDADKKLINSEIYWLEQHDFTETISIANELEQKREFAVLKAKYKATQYEDSSPSSHLYKVLKTLMSENQLSEQDINFLQNNKLSETIAIAHQKYASTLRFKVESGELLSDSEIDWLKHNQREDIITFAKQKHFTTLKKKYALVDIGNQLPFEPFYTIMLKLEKKERLDPLLVVQLIEEKLLSRYGKIPIAHYKLEADFYEQEFKRTGHKWHIPNASSYWRKADEPERALQLTNLDLSNIRESNLKSAILVTRGAAFRDIDELDNAEKCAKKAIESHPQSYQPYTLLGAIYYDKREYSTGDYYFEEAVKRGAKTEEIDDEIKRVVRTTKDEIKLQEVVNYLLKKDSQRYAWAKTYLKKSKNQA